MPKDNEKIESEDKTRLSLSYITLYYIYQQCFVKEGIINDEGIFENYLWASRLRERLKTQFDKDAEIKRPSYPNYLRDRFNAACEAINAGNLYERDGYSRLHYENVLKHANCEDYELINDAFRNPLLMPGYYIEPVVYATLPKNKSSWDVLSRDKIEQFLRPIQTDNENEKIAGTKQENTLTPEAKAIDAVVAENESAIPSINENIDVTAKFTGIYTTLNEENLTLLRDTPEECRAGAVMVACIYKSKTFTFLESLLPRIPDDGGHLYFYANGACEFKGDGHIMMDQAAIKSAEPFSMPGDKQALWAKITYLINGQRTDLYFAEQIPGTDPLKLAPPDKILGLFTSAK